MRRVSRSFRPIADRRSSSRLPALAGAVVLAASLAGCAHQPPASDPDAVAEYTEANDPAEPTNRVFYAVNNGLDTVIMRPLAVGYKYAVPYVVRSHIHNVLVNLSMPPAHVLLRAGRVGRATGFMRLRVHRLESRFTPPPPPRASAAAP